MTDQEALQPAIQALKQANAELWQPWDSAGPDTLYHYCGIDGMHGIFSSGCIWASDVMCLNDPSEIEYARALILRVLEERAVPGFIRIVFMLPERIANAVTDWRVRVFCLCEKCDDLSQWRGYGKGGGGFAVGFSRQKLLEIAVPDKSAPFALVRIMYDEENQKRQVNALIDKAYEISNAADLQPAAREQFWKEFGFELLTFLCRFKAPAFQAEAEWRLVSIEPKEEDEFRKSGSVLVPYVSLALPKNVFSNVWQGPTVNAEFGIRSLARFLICSGFGHVLPKRSAITLRA